MKYHHNILFTREKLSKIKLILKVNKEKANVVLEMVKDSGPSTVLWWLLS